MTELKSCCQREAADNLKEHQAVAVCDGCGQLVLAYGNDSDFEKTKADLEELKIEYQAGKNGKLLIVSKVRSS
ncbi:MAG: hypothetical protein P1V97_17560 [Planctomycetota bacterium]|nr:hypothetical protein [Planctomycetota bacterium]